MNNTIQILTTRIALIATLAAALLIVAPRPARANAQLSTMDINQEARVDTLGNATMTYSIHFTAAQFQNWQEKYGQNKSLLKRDMNKFVSQWETYDWDVTEKEMERQVTVTFKAKGIVRYKGDGTFEVQIPKSWRGGERSGNVVHFNYIEPAGLGAVTQYAVSVVLPDQAAKVHDQLADDGDKLIDYSMPVGGSHGWMLFTGLSAMLSGVLAVGGAMLATRFSTTVPVA